MDTTTLGLLGIATGLGFLMAIAFAMIIYIWAKQRAFQNQMIMRHTKVQIVVEKHLGYQIDEFFRREKAHEN